MRKVFDEELLRWLREVPLQEGLGALGRHISIDRDFVPVKDQRTKRWVVDAGFGKVELLVTDLKWFDMRRRRGGGGMIDLLMHLDGLSFVQAVKVLNRELGEPGPHSGGSFRKAN